MSQFNQTSAAPTKTMLYCFGCGHESPIQGDWIARETDGSFDYTCPDCGTTILSRLDKADSPPDLKVDRGCCCPCD